MKTRIVLLCLTLLGALAFIARASKPEVVPIRESLSGLPMQIGNWVGQQAPDFDPRVQEVLGVDDYVNRIYYNQKFSAANLYIGYYQSQKQGDTIHSPLNCLPGAGWNPMERSHLSIQMDDGRVIEVNRIVIQKGVERHLVLYWYQSHGRVIASEYWAKIYTVLDALRTNRTDAALVRVICPVAGNNEQSVSTAEQGAVDFLKVLFPLLEHFLPA